MSEEMHQSPPRVRFAEGVAPLPTEVLVNCLEFGGYGRLKLETRPGPSLYGVQQLHRLQLVCRAWRSAVVEVPVFLKCSPPGAFEAMAKKLEIYNAERCKAAEDLVSERSLAYVRRCGCVVESLFQNKSELNMRSITVRSADRRCGFSDESPVGLGVVNFSSLFNVRSLRELSVSVSNLEHDGETLAALAVAIADSGLDLLKVALKTGDQKPTAIITGKSHAARQADKLADEVVAKCSSRLAVSFDQPDQPSSRSLVIKRRVKSVADAILEAAKEAGEDDKEDRPLLVIRLDADLTLCVLHGAPSLVADVLAKHHNVKSWALSLVFAQRMSDSTLRRLKRLFVDQPALNIAALDCVQEEAKMAQVLEAWSTTKKSSSPPQISLLLNAVRNLRVPPTDNLGPLLGRFAALRTLKLTGVPLASTVPLTCASAVLTYTHTAKHSNPSHDLDFSQHVSLRTLHISAAGARYNLRSFPPRCLELKLEYVSFAPGAVGLLVGHQRFELLELRSCDAIDDSREPPSLSAWVEKTRPKRFVLDRCSLGGSRWALGNSPEALAELLDHVCLESLVFVDGVNFSDFHSERRSLGFGGASSELVDLLAGHQKGFRARHVSYRDNEDNRDLECIMGQDILERCAEQQQQQQHDLPVSAKR